MPSLSPLGSAILGIAEEASIDGSIPAALATFPTSGRWDWISDTVAFGMNAPDFTSTDFSLYTYDPGTLTRTLVEAYGANGTYVKSGGGNWAAWVSDGRGLKTNLPTLGPFPAGYMLSVSRQGEYVLETSFIADSGIKIYSAAGAEIDAINGILPYNDRLFARDGVLTYALTGLGWRIRDYRNQINLSLLVRNDAVDQMVPVVDGVDVWVLERNNVESLTLRKKDATLAWAVRPAAVNEYLYPDMVWMSPGNVRIAWSNDIGEAPASLYVMDVNLATGANSLATVIAGALVFVGQAPLGTTPVTGSISPGGGGGGGIIAPGSGSAGANVLAKRAAPPPRVPPARKYPHVPDIKDFATQQSVRLAWDQVSAHGESLTAIEARLAAQDQTIADLRETITQLAQSGNVLYKGSGDES